MTFILMPQISQLKKKHKGFWLAISVNERDKFGRPISGKLIAKAKTHKELHKILKNPNVYETFAGKIPTKAVLFWK